MLDMLVEILITTFWNGLLLGIFLLPLGLIWSFNKDLVTSIFRITTPYVVSALFIAIIGLAATVLGTLMNMNLGYFVYGACLLLAIFTTPKIFFLSNMGIIIWAWQYFSTELVMLEIGLVFMYLITLQAVKKAGYNKLKSFEFLAVVTMVMSATYSFNWSLDATIIRIAVSLLMFIVFQIAYFFAIHFDHIYAHAVQLKTIVEYERGNVVRAALSAESIKKFINENDVHFGIFAVLGFKGASKVSKEFGTHVLDEAVNKIIESLNDMLKYQGVIFFKANEEKFGLLLKTNAKISNIRAVEEGNYFETRDDDDFIKVIENALNQLPNTFAINDKWVELSPYAGCAIYGVHTHDIEQIIDYAEFALNTKNEFTDINVAQLFNYAKYETYKKDSDIAKRIKEVVNINNLFAMYRPVVDLKNTDTKIHKCSFEIASVEYYGLAELFAEAEKTDTGKQLARLLAQIGANSFGEYDTYDLLLPYDARVFDDKFDIFEFLNRLKKYGADPNAVILLLDARVGYYDDPSVAEHVGQLQAAGIRVMINNIEELGPKTFTTIEFIKPNYVGLGKHTVATVAKEKQSEDIIELVTGFCHDRDIEVICDGVSSKYQLEKLIELDVDYLTGPIVGTPLPMATPAPQEVDDFINNYHDKMIFKSMNK